MTDLFAYEHAANRQILNALRATPEAPDRARAVFAHILAAQRVWTERMRDGKSPTPVWPDLSLDECEAWIDANTERIAAALAPEAQTAAAQTAGASGGRAFRYHSTSGAGYESTVTEIFQHLLLHGAYHRGQIAMLIREAGGVPPATDYVYHTRRAL